MMVRQTFLSNILLFVCGGFSALILEKLCFPEAGELTVEKRLRPSIEKSPPVFQDMARPSLPVSNPPPENQPRVFTHDGTRLKRVYGFCEMLPPMDCVMMRTTSGPMPVYIHHTKSSGVSGAIYQKRGHEPHIMRTIQSELEKYPEAAFIDIGSNIGPFSLQAGKLGRVVISVDAVLMNIQRLCKSVEKNGLSQTMTMIVNPVSDQHTAVSMEKGPSPTFEMSKVSTATDVKDECGNSNMLRTVLVDDLLSLASFNTAIMKVDVEGFEYYVINGGQEFLKKIRVPAIIMEWKHVMKTKGKELIDILTGLKYWANGFTNGTYFTLHNSKYKEWPINIIWLKNY